MYGPIPTCMVKCSVKFARIHKFGCLIPRLSLKLNFGVGGIEIFVLIITSLLALNYTFSTVK